MAASAEVREGEFTGLVLGQAEVRGEGCTSDLGRRSVPSLCLSVECLREVVGEGHGGAAHNCILASRSRYLL